MNRPDNFGVIILNGLSWLGTIITFQNFQVLVTVAAGIGSIFVSLATLYWLRQQSRALDARMVREAEKE